MSAIALQRSWLLSPNEYKVRMRRYPFTSRFDGHATPLISREIYILE